MRRARPSSGCEQDPGSNGSTPSRSTVPPSAEIAAVRERVADSLVACLRCWSRCRAGSTPRSPRACSTSRASTCSGRTCAWCTSTASITGAAARARGTMRPRPPGSPGSPSRSATSRSSSSGRCSPTSPRSTRPGARRTLARGATARSSSERSCAAPTSSGSTWWRAAITCGEAGDERERVAAAPWARSREGSVVHAPHARTGSARPVAVPGRRDPEDGDPRAGRAVRSPGRDQARLAGALLRAVAATPARTRAPTSRTWCARERSSTRAAP